MTQSDYVKGELLSLQQQLQALEERAKNIEADIRNVMCMGKPTDLDTYMDWVVFIPSVLDSMFQSVMIILTPEGHLVWCLLHSCIFQQMFLYPSIHV